MTRIPPQIAARYDDLVREIRKHAYSYYVDDSPQISDRDYDLLFSELVRIEDRYPGLRRLDSPTQRVGAQPKDGFPKVRRKLKMYSLDNTYNDHELEEFANRVSAGLGGAQTVYVVEPKLDGVSIELRFRNGALILASTRGDGFEGEDVTANARTIRSLPLGIQEKGEVVIRGEVFINRADLGQINLQRQADGEPPFANPRNAASGSLRLLDQKLTAKRPLRVFFYELVRAPNMPATHSKCLEWIVDQGLPAHRLERCADSIESLRSKVREFDEMRSALPYDIDGAVVKVDDLQSRERLGHTSRFPRWAVAFKFETEKAVTTLKDISVQVGRTGALTPVAILEPVHLCGTMVSRASLHNEDEIVSKDIRVGDRVVIEKAGEIIPRIIEVVAAPESERGPMFRMPETCPICGAPTARQEGDARWRCTNRISCQGQLKASLLHFGQRSAMDIEHLGPSLIDQLVDSGLVRDPADLYSLTLEQVAALDRMAQKSAANFIFAVDASRGRSLDRLLYGLGIPLVGEVAAAQLAARYGTLSAFSEADPSLELEKCASIHGIGPKIAESVARAMEDERFTGVVHKLLGYGIDPVASSASGGKSGTAKKSFCVTGNLNLPRSDIHELINSAGGDVHTAVKKTTDYLVIGDKPGRNKVEKAEALGTKVIDEDELFNLLEVLKKQEIEDG